MIYSGEKVLALDPSSRCTGYAVLERTCPTGERLLEAGKLRGKSTCDALQRVLAMRADLKKLLEEMDPDTILVELPLEKQYTRTAGKRSGMAIWAGAAWALWMVCVQWAEEANIAAALLQGLDWSPSDARRVCPVSNTYWTRGTSKRDRQDRVHALYRQYDPKTDAGGDVADAVSMALWWLQRNVPQSGDLEITTSGDHDLITVRTPARGRKHP